MSRLDPVVEVKIGSAKSSTFQIPVPILVKREHLMREVVASQGIDQGQWHSSLIYRKWVRATEVSDRSDEFVHTDEDKIKTMMHANGNLSIFLDPQTVDCAGYNYLQSFKWKPWLSKCIRSYYNNGILKIPNNCIGNEILIALEYLEIVYTLDQLVFDSFGTHMRVKLWSEYYSQRVAMGEWIQNVLLEAPAKNSHTFVTSPMSISSDDSIFIGPCRGNLFDGGLQLHSEKYSGLPSCAVVHNFFHSDHHGQNTSGTKMAPLDELVRQDFAAYIQSSLPGTDVRFTVRNDVEIAHSASMHQCAVLQIDLHLVRVDNESDEKSIEVSLYTTESNAERGVVMPEEPIYREPSRFEPESEAQKIISRDLIEDTLTDSNYDDIERARREEERMDNIIYSVMQSSLENTYNEKNFMRWAKPKRRKNTKQRTMSETNIVDGLKFGSSLPSRHKQRQSSNVKKSEQRSNEQNAKQNASPSESKPLGSSALTNEQSNRDSDVHVMGKISHPNESKPLDSNEISKDYNKQFLDNKAIESNNTPTDLRKEKTYEKCTKLNENLPLIISQEFDQVSVKSGITGELGRLRESGFDESEGTDHEMKSSSPSERSKSLSSAVDTNGTRGKSMNDSTNVRLGTTTGLKRNLPFGVDSDDMSLSLSTIFGDLPSSLVYGGSQTQKQVLKHTSARLDERLPNHEKDTAIVQKATDSNKSWFIGGVNMKPFMNDDPVLDDGEDEYLNLARRAMTKAKATTDVNTTAKTMDVTEGKILKSILNGLVYETNTVFSTPTKCLELSKQALLTEAGKNERALLSTSSSSSSLSSKDGVYNNKKLLKSTFRTKDSIQASDKKRNVTFANDNESWDSGNSPENRQDEDTVDGTTDDGAFETYSYSSRESDSTGRSGGNQATKTSKFSRIANLYSKKRRNQNIRSNQRDRVVPSESSSSSSSEMSLNPIKEESEDSSSSYNTERATPNEADSLITDNSRRSTKNPFSRLIISKRRRQQLRNSSYQ